METPTIQRLNDKLTYLEHKLLNQDVSSHPSIQAVLNPNYVAPAPLQDGHTVPLELQQPSIHSTTPAPPGLTQAAYYTSSWNAPSQSALTISRMGNHPNQAFIHAPGPPKSTWEADKLQALLSLEAKLKKAVPPPAPHENNENQEPAHAPAQPQANVSVQDMQQRFQALGYQQVYGLAARQHAGVAATTKHATQPPTTAATGRMNTASSTAQDAQGPRVCVSSTWEHQQARAILALEEERAYLAEQLRQHTGTAAAPTQLTSKISTTARQPHNRTWVASQGAPRGGGGVSARPVTSTAAATVTSDDEVGLGQPDGKAPASSQGLAEGRQQAVRLRRLRWAERAWNQRLAARVITAWHVHTLRMKYYHVPRDTWPSAGQLLESMFRYWHDAAVSGSRLQRLEQRVRRRHLAHLLAAWHQQAGRRAGKQAQVARAELHARHCLLSKSFHVLAGCVVRSADQLDCLTIRLDKHKLRAHFNAWSGWVTWQHHVMYRMQRLRTAHVLCCWYNLTQRQRTQHAGVQDLQHTWSNRLQSLVLLAWYETAQRLGYLRDITNQLSATGKQSLLVRSFRRWSQGVKLQQLEQARSRRMTGDVWHAWRTSMCRTLRNRRVCAAFAASRLLHTCRQVLTCWQLLAAARRVRLQGDDMARMQAYVSQLQWEVEEARTERYAALTRARAFELQARLMQQEARRSLYMSSAASFASHRLQWCAATPAADSTSFIPRMRHCTHWLPAIQPPRPEEATQQLPGTYLTSQLAGPGGGPGDAGGDGQAGSSLQRTTATGPPLGPEVLPGEGWVAQEVLVVFGGVSGDTWLTDVHALVITHEELGSRTSWHPLPCDTSALPEARLPAITGAASCAAGPASFVVVGGFDGTLETLDMYLFQCGLRDGSYTYSGTGSAPFMSPVEGLGVTVQLCGPQGGPRPPGRTDHTITYDAAERRLLMFGGYASAAAGYLNDLWVYDMDTHRWWQPEVAGDWPPKRRSHVAAVVGGCLYVHGGYTGDKHLGDLWKCDLNTWTWTCVPQLGLLPAGRRGHACEVLHHQYLLITGGYDGARHLADVCVLDTTTNTWAVELHGHVGDAPPACALHTLTWSGSRCVQVGGCGALGALPTVHLLQPPGLAACQEQQRALAATAAQLALLMAQVGELQAVVDQTSWQQQDTAHQMQTVQDRSTQLVVQHQEAIQAVQELRELLATAQVDIQQAEARAHAAEVAAATCARRLTRAREGGRQVAAVVHELQQELLIADERLIHESSQLVDVQCRLDAAQSLVHQLTAERNVLHVQLAAANNEVTLLRSHSVSHTYTTPSTTTSRRPHPNSASGQVPGADVPVPSAVVGGGAGGGGGGARGGDVALPGGAGGPDAGGGVAGGVNSSMFDSGHPEALVKQLSQQTVRALAAEEQLQAVEGAYGALKLELARAVTELHQQAVASHASQETAQSALKQLRTCQLQHEQEVEDMRRQIRGLQMKLWQRETNEHRDPVQDAATGEQRDAGEALEALRQLASGGVCIQ